MAACSSLGGCGRGHAGSGDAAVTGPTARAEAGLDINTPMMMGNPVGLEVVAMIVRQPYDVFEAVLGAYRDASDALGASTSSVWTAHELRADTVPMANVAAMMDAFAAGGVASDQLAGVADTTKTNGAASSRSMGGARQWVGQSPAWQEIARGVVFPTGVTLALGGERIELPPGRLRLLSRAWIVPTPDAESGAVAALRVELVVQHLTTHGERSAKPEPGWNLETYTPPSDPTAMNEGILLPSLSVTLTLRPGEAVVITPIEPIAATPEIAENVDAESQAGPAAPGANGPIGVGRVSRGGEGDLARSAAGNEYGPRETAGAGDEPAGAGPPAPVLPTVGRALLGETSRKGAARISRRQVIVLIPRLPAKFELLEP